MSAILDSHRIEQLQSLGDPNLLGEMCELFLEHAPDRIDNILKGWEEKDFKRIEESAHSLKSSSGNLGAMELMNLCQEIESAAEQSDGKKLSDLLLKFKEQTGAVLEAVTRQKKLSMNKKVAIVEDNPDNMVLIQALLRGRYEVEIGRAHV